MLLVCKILYMFYKNRSLYLMYELRFLFYLAKNCRHHLHTETVRFSPIDKRAPMAGRRSLLSRPSGRAFVLCLGFDAESFQQLGMVSIIACLSVVSAGLFCRFWPELTVPSR